MKTFYSYELKKNVCQVNKTKANKLWNEGKDIYFHPSNLPFDCIWQHPMRAQKDGYSFSAYTFEQVCDNFSCYNCDSERGRYIHFFVEL